MRRIAKLVEKLEAESEVTLTWKVVDLPTLSAWVGHYILPHIKEQAIAGGGVYEACASMYLGVQFDSLQWGALPAFEIGGKKIRIARANQEDDGTVLVQFREGKL